MFNLTEEQEFTVITADALARFVAFAGLITDLNALEELKIQVPRLVKNALPDNNDALEQELSSVLQKVIDAFIRDEREYQNV